MPRTSKLTRDLIGRAEEMLRAGNYANTVCAALGIAEQTWYRWLKEAGEPKATAVKQEFSEAIKRATAEAEVAYVNVIQEAREKNWQAAGWWLERKMPEKWGRRDKLKVDATVNSGVLVVDEQKKATEWERLVKEQQAMSLGDNGRPN